MLPKTHLLLILDELVGTVKQSATTLPVDAAQAMQGAA
jgi:hypothetical protein